MGKRELLIIVAFVAIGAVAFELTAPPAPEGRGFSLSRWWQSARRGMRGNNFLASNTETGEIPLTPAVTELRVSGLNRGIHIVGEEDRKTISYELHVESNGPDQATATEYAKRSTLKQDDLGSSLALSVSNPVAGTQWNALVLRVPARLTVRTDGSGAEISGVTSVDLQQVQGTVAVRSVSGAVTGSHRNGDLTITDVGSVDLSLSSSRAKISGVAKSLMLSGRNGRCEIAQSHGPVEIDEQTMDTRVNEAAGPVRVSGTGGRTTITSPHQEVKVDCRRAEVEVLLDAPVPVTLLSTDETMRLTLEGPPAITLDAVASEGGKIQLEDLEIPITSADGEYRCSRAFGGASAPKVMLRSARGNVVIRKAK